MRPSFVIFPLLLVLGSLPGKGESPLVQRGGIHGREFSEAGRLYLGEDKLIHFRSDQRLYYSSHMYYIGDALKESGVVSEGKVIHDKPVRMAGNYSKAGGVYDFGEEPALRGSQIIWIDRIEKIDVGAEKESALTPLFNGKSLKGWSTSPSDEPGWP